MADAVTNAIEYRLQLPSRRPVKPASRFSQRLEAPIPRISRLMALAILLDENLRDRVDLSYTDLAQLGCVAPSRISQIMNLLYLAPDIQEQLLFLPASAGRDLICEKHIRSLAVEYDWAPQRQAFARLLPPTRSKPTFNKARAK